MTSASPTPTSAVRNIWAASWMLARGLKLVSATADQDWRCTFNFEDANGQVPDLLAQFFDDVFLQEFVNARQIMGRVLSGAREAGVVTEPELTRMLEPLARVREHPRRKP